MGGGLREGQGRVTNKSAKQRQFDATIRAGARLLIGSYFVAVSLGLTSDPQRGTLVDFIHPSPITEATVAGFLFLSGFVLMIGIWTRIAALMLILYVLASSGIQNAGNITNFTLDGFWRDLALIGGLLMAYAQSEVKPARRRTSTRLPFAPRVLPRRIKVEASARSGQSEPALTQNARRVIDTTVTARVAKVPPASTAPKPAPAKAKPATTAKPASKPKPKARPKPKAKPRAKPKPKPRVRTTATDQDPDEGNKDANILA